MQFLHIYEMPGLLEEARANWTGARAVFLQNDTFVVHMFIIVEVAEDVFYSYMVNVRKDFRDSLPKLREYEDAVWNGPDDESEHDNFEDAVREIVEFYEFHGDTTEIADLVDDIKGL